MAPTHQTCWIALFLTATLFSSTGCVQGSMTWEELQADEEPLEEEPAEQPPLEEEPMEEPIEEEPIEEEPILVDPPTCMPLERYFVREVYARVVQPQCQSCHNPLGPAAGTEFELVSPDGYGDHVERNLAMLRSIATQRIQEHDYASKLLLKPTNVIAHGGGPLIAEGSESYAILEEFVRRVEEEDACPQELPPDLFDGVEMMEDQDLLRSAALSLAGRLPTDEERQRLADGDATLDELFDGMMAEEAFLDILEEGMNDIFLLSGSDMVEGDLDPNDYPDRVWFNQFRDTDDAKFRRYRNHTRIGLRRQPYELMRYIVREGRPFSEILTADFTMVNYASAMSYGVEDQVNFEGEDPYAFAPVQLPALGEMETLGEAYPHAGIVTSHAYLKYYPTTETNRNRHRASVFFSQFLDTNVLELAPRGGGDSSAVADVFNPVRDAAECNVCHYMLDPVAGAFQNHDARGRYNPRDEGWYSDTFSPGFNDDLLPNRDAERAIQWLAEASAEDDRFARAIVGHVYEILMGRRPLEMPKDAERAGYAGALAAYEMQREWLKGIEQDFVASNHDIRVVFKAILTSPFYRAVNVDANAVAGDDERAAQIEEIGLARVLTPERLHRKIVATFGAAWRYDDKPALTDAQRFRFLYGGIDSINVTERLDDFNSVMAAVAMLMANDVPCRLGVRDFTLAPDERRLFPHVELTDVPGQVDAEANIRANIQHLYDHLLGERVAVDAPEVDIAYGLFRDIQADGARGLDAGEYDLELDAACRADGLREDPDYTARAWMAVLTYMLSDYRFLHE